MQEAAVKRVEPSPFAWRGASQSVNEQKKVSFGQTRPVMEQKEPAREEAKVTETKKPAEQQPAVVAEKPVEIVSEKAPIIPKTPAEQVAVSETKKIDYRICGQVFDTYIIVEKDNEMLMIDQHAAHERLRYEQLLLQYEERKMQSQMLLVPATVRLTAAEEAQFAEYQSALSDMGFMAESFGDKTVIIRSAPEALEEDALKALFLEVLGHLADKRKDAQGQKTQRALYTIACKSAVKAGYKLSEQETKTLLDAVFALGPVNTCPHGRPITISMTRGFIEKQFKRIV